MEDSDDGCIGPLVFDLPSDHNSDADEQAIMDQGDASGEAAHLSDVSAEMKDETVELLEGEGVCHVCDKTFEDFSANYNSVLLPR